MAAGKEPDLRVIRAAVAAETLHLASLCHDDVIDESLGRNGLPTANARMGNSPAILLGDFFFARALRAAAGISPACLRRFLDTAEELVQGEFAQANTAGHIPAPEQYMQWIGAKTARLFALAASLGRERDGRGNKSWRNLYLFGWFFGLAYQLRDDLLDLIAPPDEFDKPILNDCQRGIFTYPIIAGARREHFPLGRWAAGSREILRLEVIDKLDKTGALHATAELGRHLAAQAGEKLLFLPARPARQALAGILAWVEEPFVRLLEG
jgi:heptaprenyl diphosphate synthase